MAPVSDEKWDVYDAPDRDEKRPEDRAAAGDPLPPPVPEVAVRPARSGLVVALVALLVGAAAVVAAVVIVATRHGAPSPVRTSSAATAATPIAFAPALPSADIASFVAGLRRRAGTTMVEELTAYGDFYGVVVPPAKGQTLPRQYTWRRDGGISDDGDAVDLGPRETFDLATLDLAPIERLFAQAWHAAPDPVTGYSLRVQPPPAPGDHWIELYLHGPSQDFSAVDGDLDGTIVNQRVVHGS
jgi:hypothetical protein